MGGGPRERVKAVILVGGRGARLRPLTAGRPKAVVPILGQPFLATQFDLLRQAGFRDVVLCLGHLPRRLRPMFGDGAAFGLRLEYAVEPLPLGTGGALGRLRARLREPFLCMNGDVLWNLDFRALAATHRTSAAALTLALTRVPDAAAYGRIATCERQGMARVTAFEEKAPEAGAADISVGAYFMDPGIFDFIPRGRPVSLERDVFPEVIRSGRRIVAHRHEGYFLDIGVISRYRQAHRDALDGRIRIHGAGPANPGGVIVGKAASIHPEAVLSGPAYVGDRAVVRARARIGPYAVLGRRVVVEEGAAVEDAILWAGTRVGPEAVVRRAVVGAAGFVGREALIEGVVLGDKSVVPGFSRIPWSPDRRSP